MARASYSAASETRPVGVHVIRNSRAKAVAEEVMGGHKSAIWVSNLDGGQRGHG